MRQFQCVLTTHVTEIKETYFEIYMSIGFPLLNISNCQSVLKYLVCDSVTIWQIVYIYVTALSPNLIS